MKAPLFAVPIFLLLSYAAVAGADQVVTLDTRPDIKQSVLLIEPTGEVRGVVVMFPGHDGVVRFVKTGDGVEVEHDGGGFTVRKKTREEYRRNGLVAALVATPTGMEGGIDTPFRSSGEHTADVRSVIAFLNKKYGLKPILHGHCRGTFSPASITMLAVVPINSNDVGRSSPVVMTANVPSALTFTSEPVFGNAGEPS